jgi:hypothetical protein
MGMDYYYKRNEECLPFETNGGLHQFTSDHMGILRQLDAKMAEELYHECTVWISTDKAIELEGKLSKLFLAEFDINSRKTNSVREMLDIFEYAKDNNLSMYIS